MHPQAPVDSPAGLQKDKEDVCIAATSCIHEIKTASHRGGNSRHCVNYRHVATHASSIRIVTFEL